MIPTNSSIQNPSDETQPPLFDDLPASGMSKLPPISDDTRESIERFISHNQAVAEEAIIQIDKLPMHMRILNAGQRLYWEHFVACCRKLRHDNRIRRKKTTRKNFKVD
jgi:hypothetical protein